MRPVLLEMNGFASFREPTTVDFRDVEYFALVGPTGAGKSTVIDALTFALYGTVARWDNARTVALALAPTAGRGAVRFVFDVGGARYVVARELRRAAAGTVTVRSARLERLQDPAGTGAPEEETTPLADGAPAVTRAVEELLGLPFGDFTTCVVLPQGEFAEFLHTEPRKRQEKLVRILGLGVYDVIAREANTEASRQRVRADMLTEQLDAYADATEDAERAAVARVAELEALAERVTAAVPRLAAAAAERAAAEELVERLDTERGRLVAVAVPAGAADLDARQRAAAETVAAAGSATAVAEALDTTARERLAGAPERGPLEQVRRDHAEFAALTAERPGARERHEKARHAEAAAARDAASAHTAVGAARAARDGAAAQLTAARATVARLTAERSGLRSVRVPPGLDALESRRADAAAALARADAALADVEAADTRARAALAAAPDRGPLEQARRELRELDVVGDEHTAAAGRWRAADVALAAAAARVGVARAHLDHAQARRAAVWRTDLAAALRPTLVAGQECPVCAQEVVTVPGPLCPDPSGLSGPSGSSGRDGVDREGAELDRAERAVRAADADLERARRAEATATAERARESAEIERLDATTGRLRESLADFAADGGIPSSDEVDRALAGLDALLRAAAEADAASRAARRDREVAGRAAAAVRSEADDAAAALRAARDPLVPWGAPAVEGAADDVVAGWTSLVGWAAGEASAREAALPAAEAAVTGAEAQAGGAEVALLDAEATDRERRREETAAARAEQDAGGALTRIDDRRTVLAAALNGAPTAAEAERELAVLAELEATARTADAGLRTARSVQRVAERAAAEVAREATAEWAALRAARDPLVPLGAPAATGEELLAAWTALAGWAGREAAARVEQLIAAGAAVRAAFAAQVEAERRLVDDLKAHDVPTAVGTSTTASTTAAPGTAPVGSAAGSASAAPSAVSAAVASAPSAVAAAVERARAGRERIGERRAAAGTITADRDTAESAQQVAKLLGNLLRSDGFPRWLVASALDALVVDASRSLAELSGGQFALTHAGGEFLVIDHADADAHRPVKTLSGGETFQASLALALALSTQMSDLAASGAARLESIFLDEGFGTLDEANLEVVASTLENLAVRGDRVVGVITHVPALAERVPVRFVVSRDQRTSSVVREGM